MARRSISRHALRVVRTLGAPWSQHALASLLASPRGLLWMHRLRLFEAVIALFLWTWQLMQLSFPSGGRLDPSTVDVVLLLLLALVPTSATAVRLPLLMHTERRCASLARSFEDGGEPQVGNLLLSMLRGKAGWDMLVFSAVFIFWYAFGFFWVSVAPPCSAKFLEEATVFRCDTFKGACSCLFASSVFFLCCAIATPAVERLFHERFSPSSQKGLPPELVEQLPAYAFGTEASPPTRAECTICLEDFDLGERVRHLPCGHHFHARCVDQWLRRTPCCPLRCPDDIWVAVRTEAYDIPAEGHTWGGYSNASSHSVEHSAPAWAV